MASVPPFFLFRDMLLSRPFNRKFVDEAATAGDPDAAAVAVIVAMFADAAATAGDPVAAVEAINDANVGG